MESIVSEYVEEDEFVKQVKDDLKKIGVGVWEVSKRVNLPLDDHYTFKLNLPFQTILTGPGESSYNRFLEVHNKKFHFNDVIGETANGTILFAFKTRIDYFNEMVNNQKDWVIAAQELDPSKYEVDGGWA